MRISDDHETMGMCATDKKMFIVFLVISLKIHGNVGINFNCTAEWHMHDFKRLTNDLHTIIFCVHPSHCWKIIQKYTVISMHA